MDSLPPSLDAIVLFLHLVYAHAKPKCIQIQCLLNLNPLQTSEFSVLISISYFPKSIHFCLDCKLLRVHQMLTMQRLITSNLICQEYKAMIYPLLRFRDPPALQCIQNLTHHFTSKNV
jgi:hypothetical protein